MSQTEVKTDISIEPFAGESAKVKKNLDVFENVSLKVVVENGFEFIKALKKEARRQKAIHAVKVFEEQHKPIQEVQKEEVVSLAYEHELADSFEIYEED